MASDSAVAVVLWAAPWPATRATSGRARMSSPAAAGMTMASMARSPVPMRRRNATRSPWAQRAVSSGAVALMIDTATTP